MSRTVDEIRESRTAWVDQMIREVQVEVASESQATRVRRLPVTIRAPGLTDA